MSHAEKANDLRNQFQSVRGNPGRFKAEQVDLMAMQLDCLCDLAAALDDINAEAAKPPAVKTTKKKATTKKAAAHV